jgi:hypothetical protein
MRSQQFCRGHCPASYDLVQVFFRVQYEAAASFTEPEPFALRLDCTHSFGDSQFKEFQPFLSLPKVEFCGFQAFSDFQFNTAQLLPQFSYARLSLRDPAAFGAPAKRLLPNQCHFAGAVLVRYQPTATERTVRIFALPGCADL